MHHLSYQWVVLKKKKKGGCFKEETMLIQGVKPVGGNPVTPAVFMDTKMGWGRGGQDSSPLWVVRGQLSSELQPSQVSGDPGAHHQGSGS